MKPWCCCSGGDQVIFYMADKINFAKALQSLALSIQITFKKINKLHTYWKLKFAAERISQLYQYHGYASSPLLIIL